MAPRVAERKAAAMLCRPAIQHADPRLGLRAGREGNAANWCRQARPGAPSLPAACAANPTRPRAPRTGALVGGPKPTPANGNPHCCVATAFMQRRLPLSARRRTRFPSISCVRTRARTCIPCTHAPTHLQIPLWRKGRAGSECRLHQQAGLVVLLHRAPRPRLCGRHEPAKGDSQRAPVVRT